MDHLNEIFQNKKVQPLVDLKAGKENDGDILLSKDKTYDVIAVVDKPTPYCFILQNEKGCFDIIHISNFKEVAD